MTVFAPFRFAPIHRWVYLPDWAPLVSHDVPFKDGWSGEIEIEIRAETPLLAGGARRKPSDRREGEVWPFQLPDGRWALPPSALQGMVRSILEVATFARLGSWIDDRRFGIRDLTPPAEPYYQRRLNDVSGSRPLRVDPRVRTGWLRRRDDGVFELKRCAHARIEYDDLARLTGIATDPVPDRRDERNYRAARVWRKKSDADERYGWVGAPSKFRHSLQVEPSPAPRHDHRNGQLSIAYRKVIGLRGPTAGCVVLTGNPSDPPRNPRQASKHLEFFFFDEEPPVELAEFQARFDEFLSIHEPDDGRRENPNWRFFRDTGYPGESPFRQGGWMPIFYLDDGEGGIESFGLAFMFKLAHEKRTLDLLRNSDPRHVEAPESRAGTADEDLPSLIFGSVGGEDGGLKRRAAFDLAMAVLPEGGRLLDREPTVLLGPKPSYFPIYVRQPEGSRGARLDVVRERESRQDLAPYATYTPLDRRRYPEDRFRTPAHERPELAGVKIWPVKPVHFPPLSDDVRRNLKVQTRLRALPEGTRFEGVRLRVHNLRGIELGALLWALTFGDRAALNGEFSGKRHRLGMGKPYGLGQLALRIVGADLRPNDPRAERVSGRDALASALDAFEAHMAEAYRASGDAGAWTDSVQVKSLLKAAQAQPGERLDYMTLEDRRDRGNPDTFVGARANGWFLPRWVDGGEVPRAAAGSAAAGGARTATGRSAAGPPRVGARIKLNAVGTEGEIVQEFENEPRWAVKLDGSDTVRRYRQTLFTVIG